MKPNSFGLALASECSVHNTRNIQFIRSRSWLNAIGIVTDAFSWKTHNEWVREWADISHFAPFNLKRFHKFIYCERPAAPGPLIITSLNDSIYVCVCEYVCVIKLAWETNQVCRQSRTHMLCILAGLFSRINGPRRSNLSQHAYRAYSTNRWTFGRSEKRPAQTKRWCECQPFSTWFRN